MACLGETVDGLGTPTQVGHAVSAGATSFRWFLNEGLAEILEFFPLISDPTGKLELQFFGKEYKLKFPRYSVRKAKSRDRTYSAQIYVPSKLTRKDVELFNQNQDFGDHTIISYPEKNYQNKKYKKRNIKSVTNEILFIN